MSGRSLGVMVVGLTLAAGCAPTLSHLDAVAEARAGRDRGDPQAALTMARLVVDRGGASLGDAYEASRVAAGAGLVEGVVWSARLAEALGRDPAAWRHYRRVIEDEEAPEALVAYAATRLVHLVDRVALQAADGLALARGMARPGVGWRIAEAAESVGIRLGDAALVRAARERQGAIRRYRVAGRLGLRPATDQPSPLQPRSELFHERQPAESDGRWQGIVETRRGVVALPEDGPGVYVVAVPMPRYHGTLEVEVIGEPAVRAFISGREVAANRRLTRSAPTRMRFQVSDPRAPLELHLGTRSLAPHVRVKVRPLARSPDPRTGIRGLLARIVALELSRYDGDLLGATEVARALQGSPGALGRFEAARFTLQDGSRPHNVVAAANRRALEAIVADAPEFAEARAALGSRLADDGDEARAAALAEAGPLGDYTDAVALHLASAGSRQADARDAARRLIARLPTSCEAAERLLDIDWDRLRFDAQALDALPPCFELSLRVAALMADSRQLEGAERRFEAQRPNAGAGRRRARVLRGLARVALARGDQAAIGHARLALGEGVDRESSLELLMKAARLFGDARLLADARQRLRQSPYISSTGRRQAISRARDLGMPLADGQSIAEAARESGPAGRDGGAGSYQRLLVDRHTRVFEDGSMLHRHHEVVRLLDAHAVEARGELALPEEAEVLVARTWKPTPEGGLQPIEPEDIIEKSTISLAALEPGAITEVAYFWFDRADADTAPGWRTPRFFFESPDGWTGRARYTLKAPPDQILQVDRTPDVAAAERPEPGTLVFEMADLPRVEPEPLDPRPDRRRRSVQVVAALTDSTILSNLADRVASNVVVTPAVRAMAQEVVERLGSEASPLVLLRALHRFVVVAIQDPGLSPLGANASYAAASRSGERNVLLTALCRAVGIEAEVVLVRPHSHGKADDGVGREDETHVYPVVRATLDGLSYWLDTTSRYVPFDYLPPLVQGAPGLTLSVPAGRTVTPAAPPRGHGSRRVRVSLNVGADGSWVALGNEVITGFFAMGWRHALNAMESEPRQRALGRVVQQSLPGAVIEAVTVDELAAHSGPLGFSWRASGRVMRASSGDGALTVALSPERLAASTVLTAARTTPLLVNRAMDIDMRIEVVLPDGWGIRAAPPPVKVDHGLFHYERSSTLSADGRRLRCSKRFRLDLGTVNPDDYGVWRTATSAVDRADTMHLVIHRAE